MTLDQSLPLLIFSLGAAITPGPSNVMITATGSAAGIVRGLPCVVGAAAGMAAFLLCLAWKIANAGRAGEAGAAKPVGFFGAAFFQWVNPKGWLVAVGADIQRRHGACIGPVCRKDFLVGGFNGA